jgi:D-alanyl-D-alanine carboxypeptidase
MLKLYFLRFWIKSLEKAIKTSKRFSTSTWLKIAFVSLLLSMISFLYVGKVATLNSVTPDIMYYEDKSSSSNQTSLNEQIVHVSSHFNYYDIEIVSGHRTKKSYHNYGLAIDVTPIASPKSLLWRKSFQKYEMELGSNWKTKDYAHIQVPRGVYPISKIRKDFAEVFFNAEKELSISSRLKKSGKYKNNIYLRSPLKSEYFSGKQLTSLSIKEKEYLKKNLENLFSKKATLGFLMAVQTAEGDKNFKTIVGKSSASGNLQITQKNWVLYNQRFSNFYDNNQAIITLEIIRNQKQDKVINSFLSTDTSLILSIFTNLRTDMFFKFIYPNKIGFEELQRYFVNPFKSFGINVNDKSPTPLNWQFWLLLFNGIVNAIASLSAMVLAWVSNNRAKAEFTLKQAKDERDKLELNLKIKEMELQIATMQKELDIKSPMIILAN